MKSVPKSSVGLEHAANAGLNQPMDDKSSVSAKLTVDLTELEVMLGHVEAEKSLQQPLVEIAGELTTFHNLKSDLEGNLAMNCQENFCSLFKEAKNATSFFINSNSCRLLSFEVDTYNHKIMHIQFEIKTHGSCTSVQK